MPASNSDLTGHEADLPPEVQEAVNLVREVFPDAEVVSWTPETWGRSEKLEALKVCVQVLTRNPNLDGLGAFKATPQGKVWWSRAKELMSEVDRAAVDDGVDFDSFMLVLIGLGNHLNKRTLH
ncbi:MAG: hypothetical protein AB1641_03740 [Thermodesulfobacteriota bacterium]